MASSAQLSRIGELVGKLLLTTSTQVLPSSSVPQPSVPSQGLQLQEDLEALQRLVPRIKAVLSDAENREIQDESVKLWLKELQDVAYSADDVLDEYEYELLRAKVEAGIQADGSTLLPPQKRKYEEVSDLMITPSILSDASFWGKIAQIRGRFEEISKQRDALHLRAGDGERQFPKTAGRPPSSHLPDAPNIYGRKGDLDKVIDWLIHSDECKNSNFSVLPIVGMGGLGKTTLVQHVYQEQRVCSHFQLRGWVCVSDDFTVEKLSSRILESFTQPNPAIFSELSVIHGQLIKASEGKRFLLVLDDVWNENHELWDRLKAPLRYGVQGSAVIATTRSERVARLMQTTHFHRLNLLSVDDCRDVFLQSAFVGRDPKNHPDLMAVGYKIVQKCRGLPLAAKSLGGLLSYEDEVHKWEDILQSNVWDLGDQADEIIIPALRLSYLHLPSNLKQCFLYASVFPKDFPFGKDELVLLWMAQGLLQSKGGKQLEDIGNDYFVQLLQRSFFQCDQSFLDEKYQRFVMHDLIHDLAQSISGQRCFHIEKGKALQLCPKEVGHLSVSEGNDLIHDLAQSISGQGCFHIGERKALQLCLKEVRHLSVFGERTEEILEMLQAFHNHPTWRIRTLLFHSRVFPYLNFSEMMPSLEFLRALDLSHSSIMEVPDSIGNLKHLRYLNLQNTWIEELPESVCKLYHLQTLCLEGCDGSLCGLPRGIGRLTSLRVLVPFMVGRRNTEHIMAPISNLEFCGIEELNDLVHLRRLEIKDLQNVMNAEDARLANLREKRNIKELVLYSSGEQWCASADVQAQVLENLRPPNCLEVLGMCNYGGLKFPTWMGDDLTALSKLVRVTLDDCMRCTTLPPLGQLPCLKYLSISFLDMVEAVGHEFRGRLNHSVAFPALEKLGFTGMRSWVTWEAVQQGDFPCLRSLYIFGCDQLKVMVPLYLLPVLEVLKIGECSELESIELTCGPSSSSVPSSSSSSSSSSSLPSSMGPPPLEKIIIASCPSARFSHEDERLLLPPTLRVLHIRENCPGLVEWCVGDGGNRLAHIPSAQVRTTEGGHKRVSTSERKPWGFFFSDDDQERD